ncbi:Hypothetical_protein [Hexamita inflata]|uniref:Hypothetical_protein n=1 Tax=Hexamita inflata TaxID=28002 RepID=A0AA86PGE0_9EUKA|nr:Hypothetical protein HINF_LOCUS26600 [Hexamita inflata]
MKNYINSGATGTVHQLLFAIFPSKGCFVKRDLLCLNSFSKDFACQQQIKPAIVSNLIGFLSFQSLISTIFGQNSTSIQYLHGYQSQTNNQIYNRFNRQSSYILNFNCLLVGFNSQSYQYHK